MLRLLVLLTVLISLAWAGQEFRLEVIRHQPCPWAPGKDDDGKPYYNWTEKIKFASSDTAQLRGIRGQPGCYKIQGDALLKEAIRGSVQIHVALKHRAGADEPTAACVEYRPNGCGGYGSCLYCNPCQEAKQYENEIALVGASLTQNGKPLDCVAGVKRGVYKDIALKFCLPTVDELLDAHNIDRNVIDQLFRSQGANAKLGVFITVRIFNSQVNRLVAQQYRIEERYRESRQLSKAEPLPQYIQKELPFNKLIEDDKGFIGCHKVFGNLWIKNVRKS
jgi:hypothetical protein